MGTSTGNSGEPSVEDFLSYAQESGITVRYKGCRICDLNKPNRDLVNALFAKGYRITAVRAYLRQFDPNLVITDQDVGKHFEQGSVRVGHS